MKLPDSLPPPVCPSQIVIAARTGLGAIAGVRFLLGEVQNMTDNGTNTTSVNATLLPGLPAMTLWQNDAGAVGRRCSPTESQPAGGAHLGQ